MASILSKAWDRVSGNKGLRDELGEAIRIAEAQRDFYRDLQSAYPMSLVPGEMRDRLTEMRETGTLAQRLRYQSDEWEVVASLGGSPLNMHERLKLVRLCRVLYAKCGNARGTIRTWTNFGFGHELDVTAHDVRLAQERAAARTRAMWRGAGLSEASTTTRKRIVEAEADADPVSAWWGEFWGATRNRPWLGSHRRYLLSDKLLTDGEYWLIVFTNKATGRSTLRLVPCDEITEIVTSPDDPDMGLWYKREYTDTNNVRQCVYYRDWKVPPPDVDEESPLLVVEADDALPSDAVRADLQNPDVDVCAIHVAYEIVEGRGSPLLSSSVYWLIQYEDFAQDLMSLAAANATYARWLQHKGGSRATGALQQLLNSSLVAGGASGTGETNPRPIAGSTAISNEAVDMREAPISRAASEATSTRDMAAAMAAFGAGLFPHWWGLGDAYRLATATAMEVPLLRNFERYQAFWRSVFTDLVNVVLDQAARYGGLDSPQDSRDVDTSMRALLDTDLGQFASAIQAFADYLPEDMIRRLALQALNVPNAEDILEQVDVDAATQDQAAERLATAIHDATHMLEDLANETNGDDDREAVKMVAAALRRYSGEHD